MIPGRKRQRTMWQYKFHGESDALLAVGWVHNPRWAPKKDTVRVLIRSSDGVQTDQHMTPLEAMSIAAGIMLTVQHRGWTGDLDETSLHFNEKEAAELRKVTELARKR